MEGLADPHQRSFQEKNALCGLNSRISPRKTDQIPARLRREIGEFLILKHYICSCQACTVNKSLPSALTDFCYQPITIHLSIKEKLHEEDPEDLGDPDCCCHRAC